MLTVDQEFYSSPYYFFLRNKGNDYSLYLSAEKTITEARDKDIIIKVPKSKLEAVKKYLEKVLKEKKKKTTKELKGEIEELVNLDGALSNSKIPILDPKLHPKKLWIKLSPQLELQMTQLLVVIEHIMENPLNKK